jgi:uncharacterized protein (TIGR02594 family)
VRGWRAPQAALLALACLGLAGAAAAHGRAGPALPSLYAPGWRAGAPAIAGRAAWDATWDATWRGGGALARSGSDLAAEAARYVGAGKFTGLPGAWCADAVSFWLKATGRRPLADRMAASALRYGPHVAEPRPGDLVVMATRRGSAGHVGVVEAVEADGSIAIVSGNWGDRVARGVISRRQATAFVRP